MSYSLRSLMVALTCLLAMSVWTAAAVAQAKAPSPPPPVERAFACSFTVLVDDEVSECYDFNIPHADQDSLKRAQDACRAMLTSTLAPGWKEKNPRLKASVSMTAACNSENFFTQCIPRTQSAISGVKRYYLLDHALRYESKCDGTWSENPNFKDWLHPKKMIASALLKAWRGNQAKALSDFGSTPIEFTGTVSQVRVTDDSVPIVLLRAGSGKGDLVGLGGVGMEEASTLVVGKSVTFARCFLEGGVIGDVPIVVCDVDRRPWD